jgi:dihydrofolate reductase
MPSRRDEGATVTGRFVYWMNVSLDLRIESAPGENGDGDWMRIGQSLHEEFNRRARALSVMVQGRRMYELMDPFWPDARFDSALPAYMREYGEIWTEQPKVLVSRTRRSAAHNTRVFGATGDALAELAALRDETDGEIGVGGATLATQLLHAGLLDELLLFTHPVILAGGRSLFDGDPSVDLDLREQENIADGVTMHRYSVRGVRAR